MKGIKELFFHYKSVIFYLLFGVLTTIINWATYYICYEKAKLPNVGSTIIAWVLAVAVAFITNKIWVFNSKSFNAKTIIHEIWTFLASRISTGILDVIIMYFAVDIFAMNSTIWKLISNVIVVILNYILSKMIIFKR